MSDQGPSIADIGAARNRKIAAEQNTREETDRIAAELEGAHQDALALKDKLRQKEGDAAVPQQQAFPHGSAMSSDPSKGNTGVGEKVAEGIANTDQTVTTAVRDAVHRASEGVSAAGNAAANTAAAVVDKTKEAVQSTLGARAANAEGGVQGYEGAVFSSDDPEYKDKSSGGVTESRSPALTLDEIKGGSSNPTIATPKEELRFPSLASLLSGGKLSGRFPIIATPTEPKAPGPPSLGEGSVGVAQGDLAGGSNAVANANVAAKGIMSTIKDAFTPSGTGHIAGAPAGPSDPDPRTANVPVGDFRALHEALGIATADGSSAKHHSHGSSAGVTSDTSSAAADVSRGTTDQDNAGAMPSAQDMREGWEGLKSQAQEGFEAASDRVQLGLGSASESIQETVGTAGGGTGGTSAAGGGGILGGLADIVSGIANKVNLANSSEELMAGGVVPDAAPGPAAVGGATAAPAPEATNVAEAIDNSSASDAAAKASDAVSDAAARARDAVTGSSSDTTAAAKDKAADAAGAVKQGAADMRDKASETASAAADRVRGAGESVKQAASDAAARAADAANAAKETTVDAAAAARDSAAETMGAAGDKVSGAAGDAKAHTGGALASLVQGAKEGFVGAYDKAAELLVGDDAKPTHTPAAPTGSSDTPAAAQPPVNVAGQGGDGNLQSGAVGSGHVSAPQAGIGAVLKQGWEDLKHGGAKAPHAVSTGGETSASYDVTSNIERSKHLDDAQQAKIYKAETYSVSPGGQAASDQAATDARKTAAVAGDGRPVTGTVPHDKPDTSKVHADQKTRFDGNKGMGTGFGTGSAAPHRGDRSIKDISALFSNNHSSLDMGGLSTEEQQALVEAAAQAGMSAGRVDSTGDGGLRSWVSSMSAVWRNLGVGSAKGPLEGGQSTQEIKDNIKWDNPTQDAVIDPVRGVTKKEGHSPHHKVQMRTSEQIPPPTDPSHPGEFLKSKAERLGKVVTDTLTTSSEEAAADPNNLKGKSSDNKPDGLAHYTKHELGVAGDAISRAPEAAVSAVGTAGEIISGVAGHMVDKVKDVGSNIMQHGDFLTPEERAGKSKAAVERVEKQMDKMGDLATDHRAVQELQEERMAAIGNPAHKRETLGDMVIGPMVKDASDDTRARELAASYKEWKDEKEHGSTAGHSPDTAAGTNTSGSGVDDAVRGLGQEAGDTARSAKDVVRMKGQAAGEGVKNAADQAGSKVGGAVDSVKGLAAEAADTARATGEVVSMEASEAADALKGKTDQAASRASDAAHDAKRSAQHTAQRASDSARETADRTSAAAKDTAHRAADSARETADATKSTAKDAANRAGDSVRQTADSAKDTANRTVDSAKDAAGRVGDSVRDTAHRAGESVRETADSAKDTANRTAESAKDAAGRMGDSVRDTANRAGEKLQEGVDAVAEGTGYATGYTAESLSEAQEAAARAGEKVGTTAGGVLSSVGDAAKGLLGALLGPFEKEAAFDESTAALTGPPKDFEPIGAEQATGTNMASTQAPAVKRAPATTTTAAAPAGTDVDELRASAEDTLYTTKEGIKARVQAGIDDTARAAGLTAGHIESVVEGAKQQLAAVTEDIHVPPAELTTNTEDLLRQRQAQMQQ